MMKGLNFRLLGFLVVGLLLSVGSLFSLTFNEALARSYLEVSQQYAKDGKTRKAEEFRKAAYAMDPQVEKTSTEDVMAFLASNSAVGPLSAAEVSDRLRDEVSISSYFWTRFIKSIFDKDITSLDYLLSPQFSMKNANGQTIDRAAFIKGMTSAFEGGDFDKVSLEKIYQKDLSILSDAHPPAIRAKAAPESSNTIFARLPFWKEEQVFRFEKNNDHWYLLSIE